MVPVALLAMLFLAKEFNSMQCINLQNYGESALYSFCHNICARAPIFEAVIVLRYRKTVLLHVIILGDVISYDSLTIS